MLHEIGNELLVVVLKVLPNQIAPSSQESMFQPSSPTRRRESTPLLEKIKTDVTLAQARLAAALEGRKDEMKPAKSKDEPPIMKYLTTQVRNTRHGGQTG